MLYKGARLMRRCLILSFFAVLVVCTSSFAMTVDVSVRPTEPTMLHFSKQLTDVAARGGFNAQLQIQNSLKAGALIITPAATFSTGFCHVIFDGGETLTLSLFSDPTAETSQIILTPSKFTGTSTQGVIRSHESRYTLPQAPIATQPILDFLNTLENATPSRIRYAEPLPDGLRGTITRFERSRAGIVYELELENLTNGTVILDAADFSNYATGAVTIAGMDHYGKYELLPGSSALIYISSLSSKDL